MSLNWGNIYFELMCDQACSAVHAVMTRGGRNISTPPGDFSCTSLRFGQKPFQRQIWVPIMVEQLFGTTLLPTDNDDKLWTKHFLENSYLKTLDNDKK